MIASGRAFLSCLALAVSAALLVPQSADAASRTRRAHHVTHVAAAHHRHHATRVARSGGETVRVIRAHSRRTATAAPHMLTHG